MDLKLCDSDYRFMTVVWEHEPVKSTQLAKLCAEELGWKKSTTFTAIKKLSQKGFLENVDATVSSLVDKEACQREETQYFVKRTFGGSAPDFFAAFLDVNDVTEEEIEELRQMLDEYQEQEKKRGDL